MSTEKARRNIQPGSIIPYFGVILVFVLFGILTKGKLYTINSLLNLVNNGFAVMMCAVAATPVFARGDLDFSLGSTEGVCLMLSAYVISANTNNAFLALLLCICVGCLVGFINGFITNVLGISAFVTTIAMNYILRGAVYTMVDRKPGNFPVAYAGTYNTIRCLIILILVIAVTFILMEYTKLGKVDKLDGENELAVEFSGLNNKLFGILSFMFLGIVTGIASFLVSPRFTQVLGNVGSSLAIDVLVACMIGGQSMNGGMMSRVSRPIIGALIISVLNQGYALMNVDIAINQFTKSILFIVILAVTSPAAGKLLQKFRKNKVPA